MKRLGELALPDSMEWIDRYGVSRVTQTVGRTLGGTPVIWSRPLEGGEPITLAATRDTTWLERTAVETLTAMAAESGTTHTLTWDTFTCTVLFRHRDAPAVDMVPTWPHHDHFIGTIKLMRI